VKEKNAKPSKLLFRRLQNLYVKTLYINYLFVTACIAVLFNDVFIQSSVDLRWKRTISLILRLSCSHSCHIFAYFLYRETWSRVSSETHSKCKYMYGFVPAPWVWSGPLSGRGLEARKRFTVASAVSGLRSGTLFYANRLSFFLVSRRALSPRRAKRSQLLRHALPSLPYLRCNLFPGINAPGIFPAATDLARARHIVCTSCR